MASNWVLFSSNLSRFLSSKSSSGPTETGRKLAEFYLEAIQTSQTPYGNIFGQAPGSEALKIALGSVFEQLAKSDSPTADEKKKDPKFEPEPERDLPDPSSAEKEFEKRFRESLIQNKDVKFQFYEISDDPSVYVLETRILLRKDLFEKRGGKLKASEREKKYKEELVLYSELKKKFSESESSNQSIESSSDEPKELDPYDSMALAFIAFWSTSGPLVFSGLPPVPPATEPVPGTFQVIFPGNPWVLSNSLRRAFNLGLSKKFESDPTGLLSATAISTALASAFAIHLASLKFLYSGTISGTPVVSPVPFVF